MASIADVNLKLMAASALLDTDPAAAARAAGEILGHNPQNRAASLLLATAARKVGDAALAVEVLGALARSQPAAPLIRLELARAYREAGRAAESVAALREALSIEPGLAEGWHELSSQLAAAGDEHGADVAYQRYAELAPQPWQLAEPGEALAGNRVAAAEAMLRRILRDAPQDVAAMRTLADALARREAYVEAERVLRQALDLAPGYSAARHDLARLFLKQQKPADTLPLVERLLRLDPKNRLYRDLWASALSMTGQFAPALEIFRALAAEPNAGYAEWLNYGHELNAAGRSQEAIAAYRKAIALDPTRGDTYWSLANLKTFRFDAAEIDAMRSALQREDLKPNDRVDLEFALGKALEDQRRFAESFEHYAAGNALRRLRVDYDAGKTSLHVRRSKEIFTPQFFAERAHFGSQASDPIFIVGLPRAGSTLLEQILASHSQVEGTMRAGGDARHCPRDRRRRMARRMRAGFSRHCAPLEAARVGALARPLSRADTHPPSRRSAAIHRQDAEQFPAHRPYPPDASERAASSMRAAIRSGVVSPPSSSISRRGRLFTYDLIDLARYYARLRRADGALSMQCCRAAMHRVYYERDGRGSCLLRCAVLLEYSAACRSRSQCLRFYENRRVVHNSERRAGTPTDLCARCGSMAQFRALARALEASSREPGRALPGSPKEMMFRPPEYMIMFAEVPGAIAGARSRLSLHRLQPGVQNQHL